jgi:hypothetical protein
VHTQPGSAQNLGRRPSEGRQGFESPASADAIDETRLLIGDGRYGDRQESGGTVCAQGRAIAAQ